MKNALLCWCLINTYIKSLNKRLKTIFFFFLLIKQLCFGYTRNPLNQDGLYACLVESCPRGYKDFDQWRQFCVTILVAALIITTRSIVSYHILQIRNFHLINWTVGVHWIFAEILYKKIKSFLPLPTITDNKKTMFVKKKNTFSGGVPLNDVI